MKKLLLACILLATTTISFAQSSETSNSDYGKNIISFNPVHLITRDFVGVGFSYERIINNYLGLRVPVMFGINNNYTNISLQAKLYPTKNMGPVKYAIAPTVTVGMGTRKYDRYYTGNGTYQDLTRSANHVGFLLNQTMNVTISKQFYIGLEGGVGINYFDDDVDTYNNSNISAIAQLNFGLGYRF